MDVTCRKERPSTRRRPLQSSEYHPNRLRRMSQSGMKCCYRSQSTGAMATSEFLFSLSFFSLASASTKGVVVAERTSTPDFRILASCAATFGSLRSKGPPFTGFCECDLPIGDAFEACSPGAAFADGAVTTAPSNKAVVAAVISLSAFKMIPLIAYERSLAATFDCFIHPQWGHPYGETISETRP